MKTKILFSFFLLFALAPARGQGTAFTYQGRLNDGGAPANGSYDLQFILFNTNQFGFPAAPILTNAAVSVNNGLFTTTLDFGGGVFTGSNFWLDISVRTNGSGAFTDLSPRQPITPTPYAITAEYLAGVVENNSIQGGVSLATIGGGGGNVIQSGANNATIGGGGYNTIQSGADHSTIGGGYSNGIETGAWESFIGGGQGNFIESNAVWSALGGGLNNVIQPNATYSAIFGGWGNTLYAPYGFIGGGYFNTIQTNAGYSTIGGGDQNAIQPNAGASTISGGIQNMIQTGAYESAIGGGYFNVIQTNAYFSTISGGVLNTIQTNASWSTISGGAQNTIQTNASYSTIGGGEGNTIQTNAGYSTIGGGDQNTIQPNAGASTISGGIQNMIQIGAYQSAIGGGYFNQIQTNAYYSTIGGGVQNTIQPYATFSTIGGGRNNTLQTNAQQSFIGGGYQNTVQADAQNDVIGGGDFNMIQTSSEHVTISGGLGNTIQSNAYASAIGGGESNNVSGSVATVPGGYGNLAGGNYSFAAGQQAQALHQGAFVWADSQNAPFASTANDQYLIRAQGGVGINMNNPNGASLYVQGNRSGNPGNSFLQSVGFFENTSGASGTPGSSPALRVVCDGGSSPEGALCVSANGTGPIAKFGNSGGFVVTIANDGTVISKGSALTSDRNAKENFTTLDSQIVLAKVAALPLTKWNYKDDSSDKKHIGPMAQDFHAAFGLNGSDDRHISVVDEGGVALAAIQGLNQKFEETQQAVKAKDREIQELKQRLEALEKIILSQKSK
jgi:hypothetical protein